MVRKVEPLNPEEWWVLDPDLIGVDPDIDRGQFLMNYAENFQA